MDLLVTLIGNAAVHPGFRTLFLENPEEIAEAYGFRLTKGDHEIMTAVFANLGAEDKQKLAQAFEALEIEVYKRLQPENVAVVQPKRCMKPCGLSLWPPREIREQLKQLDKEAAA